jgi:hypothetical protein
MTVRHKPVVEESLKPSDEAGRPVKVGTKSGVVTNMPTGMRFARRAALRLSGGLASRDLRGL